MRARGAIDFDDLVVRAADLLDGDAALRQRWQGRFLHVCVDEFQDVDAAQLRLVRLLAAPEDNLFVVGDDDQTIYAWRLADVRRILRFTDEYPAARRVMLATNYRCPRIAVERAAALVAVNRERFAKPIRAPTDLVLDSGAMTAWSIAGDDWARRLATVAAAEDAAGRTCCFLTRTRAELMPVVLALVRLGVRHTGAAEPLVDAEPVREVVERLRADTGSEPAVKVVRRLRAAAGWSRSQPSGDLLSDEDHAALDALTGWALPYATGRGFLAAFDRATSRIRALREPDATVELTTVHGSKGREWETVVIVGFEADRMPNRRSLIEAADPGRAMEEERRLAYVALTRATRRLVLAFDPARASPFLAEMGLATSGAG
jgi:DNA helicase-2/ATP-dependent DNA helicase PcrA